MNLDSLSFALSQICYLVTNLTKKNYKQSVQDIYHLVSAYGLEAERHLLRCLFSHIDFSAEGTKTSSSKDFHQILLLSQECTSLLTKPTFISSICYATDNPLHHQKTLKPSSQLLPQVSKVLKLTPVQEVAFGLALLHSLNLETQNFAAQFLKARLPDLIVSYINTETASNQQELSLRDIPSEVLHLIVVSLLQGFKDQFGISTETREAFLQALRKEFTEESVPVILAPLLYPVKATFPMDKGNQENLSITTMMDGSLADLIMEMGYGFCSSVEECRNNLISLGAREMTPAMTARVLSMMVRTHTGLDEQVGLQNLQNPANYWGNSNDSGSKEKGSSDSSHPNTWNVEIFAQALKELVPNLQWNDVIMELDHSEFMVKERQGLNLLMTALRLGLQNQGYHPDVFPVDLIYRHWKNVDGQFSLIQQILKNPDLFCFADYHYHSVPVDLLKAPPDSDNKDIATWRSMDLVDVLLYLAERGLYAQVQELFKIPVQHCPDVLMLSLLQFSAPVTVLRQELLTSLIPIFLGNHPNSVIILHQAWHSQNVSIRPIIMHAMAEWYLRGENDQSRLSRILDVAQDLKALSMLLNASSFPFVIDLACLASRREYLKLEKWLTDKIREHGEPFISACVKFLQRRCPQIMGNKDGESQPKSAQLPHETLTTMLACLQVCAGNVSQELSEAILTMIANCSILMSKPRQPPPGVLRTHRGIEPAFSTPLGGQQLFTASQVDTIGGINTSLASINIAGAPGGLGPPSSQAFNLPGALGQLVTNPGSPSRLMGGAVSGPGPGPGPSQSPFPLLPQQLQQSGPVGSQVGPGPGSNPASLVPSVGLGVGAIGALSRSLGPQSGMDKARIGAETASIFPDMAGTVSKEIEDEANSYFQRIYNHPPHPTLSIDEVLEMLKKFQDSPSKREREVFNCMLRNLFEEYRFFPQYPDKELHITAQLFGGIIERRLVSSYMALGLALRFVLDALRKPTTSKMYFFGIAALDRFKTRLKEYHKYCEHVAAIPHFHEFPPHLIEYVEYGLQSQEPPNRPTGPVLPVSLASILSPMPSVTTGYKTLTSTTVTTTTSSAKSTTTTPAIAARPSIANATNIDTLLVATEKEEKMTAPPEALQDKIGFVFNNLSQLNLQSKCDELREIVTEEYYPWMAQYLVMKRASIELNFHSLYSNCLDVLKIPELNQMVLRETFRNIKVLLRSDKGIANFSDRSLLKNLGHWLGMLTLAKNRPILQEDIDLKALLAEAYHKGQQELLYVVPFVAKVLESCAKSKVFKPPNPWTMGIMNVLAELHQEPDLKLNLKFEIEVLCKNLNIDVSELKPSLYLKDQEKLRNLEYQLSHPSKKQEAIVQPTMSQSPAQSQPATSTAPSAAPVEEMAQITISSAATPPTSVAPTNTTPTSSLPTGPPEPRFGYMDICISTVNSLAPHITINSQLALFQTHPQLKQFVRPAVERAIQEWIHPVVDRSIKIALTTCEQIIKKDFALDPDESRMRAAAHHMVRNLTAGMAMITCRDQLLVSISTNLKTAFVSVLTGATPQQKEMIEQAAQVAAQDNMELACAFIQKTAIEKAVPEIDKRLLNEFELRKHARNEGRRYCDPLVLTYQAERMPEQIRLKVGGVTPPQMAVYEEFARNIPGFLPITERDTALFIPKPVTQEAANLTFQSAGPSHLQVYGAAEDIVIIYDKLGNEVDHCLQTIIGSQPVMSSSNCQVGGLHSLLESILVAKRQRDVTSAVQLLQKAVEGLLDGMTQVPLDPETVLRYRDIHLRVLKALQDQRAYGIQWTNKQVTRFLTECREEYRYNLEAVDCLIRSHLVNLQQYDLHLAHSMEGGLNYMAVAFAMQLVQLYLIDERLNGIVSEGDFCNTVEMLARIATHSRQPPEGLTTLIDLLRANHDPAMLVDRAQGGPTAYIHSGILQVRSQPLLQAREFDDPPGLLEKTEYLLRDWVQIYHSPNAARDPTRAFSMFVQQMNGHGILKTDDLITRFFRLSTQMCVDVCYRALAEQNGSPTMVRAKCFHTLDAFVRLIALLVKHSGDASNTTTKINLLNKVLGIVAGVLLQDHDNRLADFQQLPYHRIFIMLFLELNAPEPILEAINFQVLTAFCHTMHILRPAKAPGFAYAWLELISHRVFIGRMLALTPQQKGWGMYAQLLIDLFKFLAPFLRNAELAKPVTLLYKGTLRVLLVLLHDFPEFLCDYHYGFCDVIPPNCIQMRNLILSAFPRNMRLPDPFTPNLKVDMLPEIIHAPRVITNFASMIQPMSFKKDLDSYLKARAPVTFLSELRSNLQVSNEPGMRYNIPLMNALVLYVGTQAIAYIRNKGLTPNMSTIAHSSHMDIFQNLAVDLDTEGRYLFLNAIANQLRYPNSQTHYFSCTLLYLFAEANTEAIQEQITRVLLERLIVNRPHPWGLLITFIELIKNPTYKFWNHEFVHCAPEIEKLFESVARSCMVQKQGQPSQENEMPE
ncbi:CCR4-NOT transcription complex subunit 1 isoform X4 [Schistocerca cancellata]|uniref:CCR4-NOT transcription complex subunit 1 isoform X4 n=1 Tax=Schistocerca cancellata TaxID=274614 RepID=UPI002117650B|nr:CCR4-NOT transcription complex subunit 1 isoform X4 [Schistocerca cancellata]